MNISEAKRRILELERNLVKKLTGAIYVASITPDTSLGESLQILSNSEVWLVDENLDTYPLGTITSGSMSGSLSGAASQVGFFSSTNNLTSSANLIWNQSSNSLILTGSLSVLGGLTGSLEGTSSWAINSVSASYFSGSISNALTADTASYALTASYVVLAQTASYVLNAVSASYASTASYVANAQTASYVLNAVSSSYALTASYALNAGGIDTGSLVTTSSFNNFTASYNTGSFTGSFVGSFQGTASWADNAVTASYVLNAVSSSYASTASYVQTAQTASYVLNAVTASYVLNAVSASYTTNALSASYVLNAISSSYAATSSHSLTLGASLVSLGGGNQVRLLNSAGTQIGATVTIDNVGTAGTANNVSGWGLATAEEINAGTVAGGTYAKIINSEKLEQSKHSTINIFNNLNFF